MKRYKAILIGIFFVVCLFIIGIANGWFAAGSYSYAQKYQFDTSLEQLQKSIQKLKENSYDFKLLKDVVDHTDRNGNFHIYFYSPEHDEVTHVFIESDEKDPSKSNLFLVGFSKGDTLGNWKSINRDYNRNENLSKKNRFKSRILAKLPFNYEDRGNAMFVFWK